MKLRMHGSTGTATRTVQLSRDQGAVGQATRFAELAVTSHDDACREATTMAVAELAENIVKYSAAEHQRRAGEIAIECDARCVRIRATTDVVSSADDAHRAIETVAQIAGAPSVADLYRRRLRVLFNDPNLPRAQLGLLRIAFEGGFRLSCSHEGRRLEIVAERDCEPPR
jgi:hypothetical protein